MGAVGGSGWERHYMSVLGRCPPHAHAHRHTCHLVTPMPILELCELILWAQLRRSQSHGIHWRFVRTPALWSYFPCSLGEQTDAFCCPWLKKQRTLPLSCLRCIAPPARTHYCHAVWVDRGGSPRRGGGIVFISSKEDACLAKPSSGAAGGK